MKKTLAALALIIIVGLATAIKGFMNEFTTSKPSPDAVSRSIDQAKSENVFIQEISIEPGFIETAEGKRKIESAWVEKNSDHAYRLIWFHYRKEKVGYKVVLKPQKGDMIWPLLMLPDEGNSFMNINGGFLFHETIDVPPAWPLIIEQRSSFDEPLIQSFTLKPKA